MYAERSQPAREREIVWKPAPRQPTCPAALAESAAGETAAACQQARGDKRGETRARLPSPLAPVGVANFADQGSLGGRAPRIPLSRPPAPPRRCTLGPMLLDSSANRRRRPPPRRARTRGLPAQRAMCCFRAEREAARGMGPSSGRILRAVVAAEEGGNCVTDTRPTLTIMLTMLDRSENLCRHAFSGQHTHAAELLQRCRTILSLSRHADCRACRAPGARGARGARSAAGHRLGDAHLLQHERLRVHGMCRRPLRPVERLWRAGAKLGAQTQGPRCVEDCRFCGLPPSKLSGLH